jgi:hypothetical protein
LLPKGQDLTMKVRAFWVGPVLAMTLLVPWLFRPTGGLTGDHPTHWAAVEQWANTWHQGGWWPAYLEEVNNGLGSFWPLYYPPLYHAVCALGACLGLSYWHVAWIFIELAACVGPLLCYGWLRNHVPPRAALAGMLAYCLTPYLLLDVYYRGAFPEAIALQFFPGVLWGCDMVRKQWSWPGVLLGAISFGLIILMNLPATAVTLYGTAIYLSAAGLVQRRVSPVVRGLTIPAVGLALTAFFWVPAWTERSMVMLPISVIRDNPRAAHFVSLRFFGDLSDVDVFDWCVGSLLVATIVLALVGSRTLHRAHTPYWLAALLLVLCGVLLTTEGAAWVYGVLPLLASLQFPWRCLGMVAPGMALLAAHAGLASRRLRWVSMGVATILLGLLATLWFHGDLASADCLPAHSRRIIGNYIPVSARLPRDSHVAFPAVEPSSKDVDPQVLCWRPGLRVIATWSDAPFSFLLRTYADPRWKAYDQDHRPLVSGLSSEDHWGRLEIQAPAGTSLVTVKLEPTWSAYLGTAITIITLGGLPFVAWRGWRTRHVATRPVTIVGTRISAIEHSALDRLPDQHDRFD